MSRINPGASASTVEQDLAALLRIDALALNRRRRKLGLRIGFPLALLLGMFTISILHEEGGLAAKGGYGERATVPSIQASVHAPAVAPSTVPKPLALAGPSSVIVIKDAPSVRFAPDDRQRSKPAVRPKISDARVVAATSKRPGFEIAEDNKELHPEKVPRDEAMVDVAKVRRVTRDETIDDVRFLRLQ